MTETLPSPSLAEPPLAEQKLRGVLSAMEAAVGALLETESVDRFGRAARLCVMGQKISGELVTSIKEAKKVRALDHQANAIMGGLGAEAQYVAQGGGDVNGLVEDYADHAILNPPDNGVGLGQYIGGGVAMPRFAGDQTQMMRDLMMMVQAWFEGQKKAKQAPLEDPATGMSRHQLCSELNELLRVRGALQSPADAPLLARVQKQIEGYVDLIAKGKPDDLSNPPDTDVVPAELLRGHPPRAGEQWGNAGDPGRPVLHREGGGQIALGGGEEEGDQQAAVG